MLVPGWQDMSIVQYYYGAVLHPLAKHNPITDCSSGGAGQQERMATELPPPIVAAAETMQETAETVQETAECFAGGELNVSGLVAIIVFYVAVLLVGVWASWRTRKAEQNTEQVNTRAQLWFGLVSVCLFYGQRKLTAH